MNVDVQNRCRPRDVSWRHLTPVSAICHLVILFIWFKGMPENNSWMEDVIQSPATTRTVLVSPIVNAQDAVQFDAPEAVSADENPFVDEIPEHPAPVEMHFERPNANIDIKKSAPVINNINNNADNVNPVQTPETHALEPLEPPHDIQKSDKIHEKNLEIGSESLIAGNSANDIDNRDNSSASGSSENINISGNTIHSSAQSAENATNPGHSTTTSQNSANIWSAYIKELNAHFKRYQFYPSMARQRRLTGKTIVSVEIRRDGTVISAQIKESSGHALLDDAAIKSALKASPAPAFPALATENQKTVTIPYQFTLK